MERNPPKAWNGAVLYALIYPTCISKIKYCFYIRDFVNSIGNKFGEVSSTPLQRLLLVSLKARLYNLQKNLQIQS